MNPAPTMPWYPEDDACEDGATLPPPPAFAFRVTPRHRPIEELLDGEQANTPFGPCFVATSSTPLDRPHGSTTLSSLFHFDPTLIAEISRDAADAGFDLRRAAFLDTETTGLAGGTGTYAFLVGVGYFTATSFEVRQFFLRDYSNEKALLYALNMSCIELGLNSLVTFNGKCFDLPLLETRYTMARMRFNLSAARHLDLLAPSRRLWRGRLDSCALRSLEQHILGVQRSSNDVPGYLIPSLYFDYLRSGDAWPLQHVFYHNQQDIISMPALVHHLARAFAEPNCLEEASDLLGLGRCLEDNRQHERALQVYALALERSVTAQAHTAAAERLSYLHKRMGNTDQARAVWHSLVERRVNILFPYIELAKHYEHKERDYQKAAHLTAAALNLAYTRHAPLSERQEIEKRLARIRKKMLVLLLPPLLQYFPQ